MDIKMKSLTIYIIEFFIAISLVSCGGGSGSSNSASSSNSNTTTDLSVAIPPNQFMSISDYALLPNSTTGSGPGGVLSPSNLQSHYNIPTNLTGLGQTIAIVDAPGAFSTSQIISDLTTFSNYYGLPVLPVCTGSNTPCITVINLSTSNASLPNRSGNNDWSLEIALDIQSAHSIAPKASILLIIAPSNSFTNLYSAVQTAINTAGVTAISMSFASTEDSTLHTNYDPIFSSGITSKGIAFFASTGDYGDTSPSVPQYPASSPYVTAVGGTYITSLTGVASSSNEKTWGRVTSSVQTGSGGGYSALTTAPSWQTVSLFPLIFQSSALNSANLGKRSIPDVSYNGDVYSGVGIVVGGAWSVIGGTSASSPQWAAISALLGEYLVNKGSSLSARIKAAGAGGFNALIYSLASYTGASPSFVDITTGTNGTCGTLCNAQTGYDDTTGIGVPNVSNFINQF